MSAERFPRLILLAALLCAGCILDGRRSGTSTTTENTLTGVARLPDGSAAAGASIQARSAQVRLTDDKVPASQLIASAVAGPDGSFRLAVPDTLAFFLEIEAVDTGSNTEIHFRKFGEPLARDTALGNIVLEPASRIFGRLAADRSWAGESIWIGIPGTGRFTRLDFPATGDSSVPFLLDRVPSGEIPLVLVRPDEATISGNGLVVAADSLATVSTAPGAAGNAGTLTFIEP